jgi:hypothetical protein
MRITVAIAAFALVGVIAAQGLVLRDVRRELAGVREALGRLEARDDSEASARARMAAALAAAGASAAAPPPRLGAPAAAGATAVSAAAATVPAVTAEQVADLVDRKVEARLKEASKKAPPSGDRKLPLHDLAKELGLDPATESRAAEVANAAKRDIFELAKTPRPDGTSLADELVEAMLKGDEKAAKQVFAKLFTEKVPGTGDTYIAAVARIQERAGRGLESVLGSDAYTRFRHMNVKPENIETGYDPWADHVRRRGGK